MIVRRIDPLSLAKIAGAVYAGVGLLIGVVFSFVAMAGGFSSENKFGGLFALIFGLGAVIFVPLFYALAGFVGGLLSAWLYNIVAGVTDGVRVEVQWPNTPPPAGPTV